MKRKGTLKEPHASYRGAHLARRHERQKQRRLGSSISEKRFEKTRQARKQAKTSQRRNRR